MAANQAQARRVFLTQRLINKQITMEEATELFTLMSREAEGLRRALASMPAPAARGEVAPKPKVSPPSPGSDLANMSIEDLLLFGAPMMAILAALVKKSGLDQLTAPPPPAAKPKSAASTKPGS